MHLKHNRKLRVCSKLTNRKTLDNINKTQLTRQSGDIEVMKDTN